MTHKRYIGVIALAALVSWLSWTLILFKLDPFAQSAIALPLFFLTFFTAVACTLTVLGFYLRLWLYHNEVFYKHINVSFRQGIILGLVAMFCIVFEILDVLNWITAFVLLFVALLIEFYFSSREDSYS